MISSRAVPRRELGLNMRKASRTTLRVMLSSPMHSVLRS